MFDRWYFIRLSSVIRCIEGAAEFRVGCGNLSKVLLRDSTIVVTIAVFVQSLNSCKDVMRTGTLTISKRVP